jgi:hypothetical protein
MSGSFFIALLVSRYLRCEYDIERVNKIYVNVNMFYFIVYSYFSYVNQVIREGRSSMWVKQVENIFLLFLLSKRKCNSFLCHQIYN